MKLFSRLLPLALFTVLSATYGKTTNTNTMSSTATATLSTTSSTSSSSSSTSSSATGTLSTVTSTLSTTSSTSSSPSSTSSSPSSTSLPPTTPYNITEKFCYLSSASKDFKNDFASGTCPNDSEIRNINESFISCDQMCIWNPFLTFIEHNRTIVTAGYCPENSTCSDGASMFGSCGQFQPCLSGLDCNETLKICIQTKALILSPILTMVAIVLGIYVTMVIRKKNKYRNRLRLNDDDDGSSYFHNNSSGADANDIAISLPTLAYKPNRGGQNDASMGKKDIGLPHIGELRTDDLMLFGDQTK